MKFKLRKKSGVNGTEIKVSVFFSPEETETGLTSVRDDENVHLDLLRADGDDFVKADHALMLLRSLCHYADLWRLRDNPAIRAHILHGVEFMKARAEAQKPRRRKKRRSRR